MKKVNIPFNDITSIKLVEYDNSKYSTIYFGTNSDYKIKKLNFDNFSNLDTKVVRTIDVSFDEDTYTTTYLHPDNYYITAFSDNDNNFFPSIGEMSNIRKEITVLPKEVKSMSIIFDKTIR